MSQYPGHPAHPNETALARRVKAAIAAEIVGIFNDRSRGETPVKR
jgi:hypothetical protein